MRSRWTAVAVSVFLLGSTGARAQQLERRFPSVTVVRPGPVPAALAIEPAPGTRHSLLNAVLYAAGGAVVGGWVGYLTSQVVWSDWQNASRPGGVNRMRYALTGAGVGLIGGAFLGHHLGGGAPAPPWRRRTPWGNLPVITAGEIHVSHARNAAELIAELRPDWIRRSGTGSFAGAAVQTYTMEGVAVYLDGVPIGNLRDLTSVSTDRVDSVEYYDVNAASLRWGTGRFQVIINVITSQGRS